MLYRTATESDLAQLAAMRWDFRTELAEDRSPSVSREEFLRECEAFLRRGMAEGNWVYWVAEQDGRIMSHVCVQTVRKIPNPRALHGAWGYATNVYTRPERRNQGTASELIRRVQD